MKYEKRIGKYKTRLAIKFKNLLRFAQFFFILLFISSKTSSSLFISLSNKI